MHRILRIEVADSITSLLLDNESRRRSRLSYCGDDHSHDFYAKLTQIGIAGLSVILLLAFFQPTEARAYEGVQEARASEDLEETITGSVIDSDTDETLPGANILLKGSESIGTSTNANGEFSLAVPSLQDTLIVSFVGYQRTEVPIEGRTEILVQLQSAAVSGDELIVIGYGEERRRDLTGAVSTLRAGDLQGRTVNSPDQLLQGKVPGVQLTSGSGQPGSATNILIRGGTSISAGNLPLFVIDGIPINISAGRTTAGTLNGEDINPLASINPNDIESISVLKDASATAIYGARGASGVVLITTKTGGEQTEVRYSGSLGIQSEPPKFPVLNATEFAELNREAFINDGLEPLFTAQEAADFGEGTDWQDEIFEVGTVQKHYLSIGGSGDDIQYFISGGYDSTDGTIIESDFERLNLRLNLNADLSDRVRIGNNFTTSRITSNIIKSSENSGGSGAGVILASLIFNPTIPVFAEDGSYNLINLPDGGQPSPVATAREITNQSERYNYTNSFFGEIDLADGLTFRTDLGINIDNAKENFFRPDFIQIVTPLNEGSVATINSNNWVSNNILRYETELQRLHSDNKLDVSLGFTREGSSREILQGSAQGFPTNELEFFNLSSGEQFSSPNTFEESSDLISYLSRINYQLMDRYLLTLSGRIDGSSRFGDENKYGFFPSGAIAWNISEEGFMTGLDLVDDLKLRLSYGRTGNQEIGNFRSLSLMGTSVYLIGESVENAVFPQSISNPDLKWETTDQLNVGFDLQAFDRKLSLTADFYNKKTSDLLLNTPLPFTSGFDQSVINLGDIRNRGIEFGLGANSLNLRGVNVNAGLNMSFNNNEILSLGGLEPFFAGGRQFTAGGENILIIEEGRSIGTFVGLKSDGIFQNGQEVANSAQPDAQPGDERFVDVNADGQIDSADRAVIGSAQPDFTGGFSANLFYKNVELGLNLNFVYGNDIFNGNRFAMERPNGRVNGNRALLDRWSPDNPDASVPRASRTSNRTFSDRFLEDGSFLRLQSLSLAYNIPSLAFSGFSLRNLRVYVRGENLFVLTSYSGFDPEVNSFGQDFLTQGYDLGVYPKNQLFTAGIDISF